VSVHGALLSSNSDLKQGSGFWNYVALQSFSLGITLVVFQPLQTKVLHRNFLLKGGEDQGHPHLMWEMDDKANYDVMI